MRIEIWLFLTALLACSAVIVVLTRRLGRARADKERSESRYRTIVEQADDGILLVDAATGKLLEANPALQRRLGYSADQITSLRLEDVLVEAAPMPDVGAFNTSTYTRTHARGLRQRCRDGRLLDVEVTASHLEMDGRQVLCYIAHDVTERKRIELELLRNQHHLEHLAHHDSLTGLPNRLFLRNYLENALRSCAASSGLAVMFLDLDLFKVINDSRGHAFGDELLVEVARQLKALTGSRGIVARLGGDEFVVVLRGVTNREDAARDAESILSVFSRPLHVAGRVISISVSIGVTLCPQDADDTDSVLCNADLAMYKAKESGRSAVQFFQPDMNRHARRRLAMERALRRAIAAREFVVHYHPLIEIPSRRIVGLEALVRWQHPRLGLIPPSRFISVAEDSGLILAIGEQVFRSACEQVVQWQREGVPVVPVAINWSAIQLQRQSVVEIVRRVLRETGMPPHLLSLEITEGTLMRDASQHAGALQSLRDEGVHIEIDDFGTGYSSLSYLRQLPVDTLKVDRSFVEHVDQNPTDEAIVRAILAMAGTLGLRVVAEGVETASQLDVLRRLGCQVAQGFYFSRPLPAEDCRTLLEALSTRPAFTDTLRMRLRRGLLVAEQQLPRAG